RTLHVVAERRAGQRLDERAAEIQRAQLGDRQAGRQALEGLAVHPPARLAVVGRSIVVEREAGGLQGLEITPDGSSRDLAEAGEPVEGEAPARSPVRAQVRPLRDALGFPRPLEILPPQGSATKTRRHEATKRY